MASDPTRIDGAANDRLRAWCNRVGAGETAPAAFVSLRTARAIHWFVMGGLVGFTLAWAVWS